MRHLTGLREIFGIRYRWSRWAQVGFVFTVLTTPAAAHAQQAKVDSLLLHLPLSRAAALDRVVGAFMSVGLTVTNTTNSLVESDQGKTTDSWLTGIDRARVVRAVLYGSDSSTTVFLVGSETQTMGTGQTRDKLRIDNKAKGNGGKVWRKMVAVAMALDSMQVPRAVRTGVADTVVYAPPDTRYSFGGSLKGREFYPVTCKKVLGIPQTDVVWFASAKEAVRLGFHQGDTTTGCDRP